MAIIEETRTVTIDGRVVIPWVIQQALGLDYGGPVCFHVENGVVTLRAVDARARRAAPNGGVAANGRRDVRAALTDELNTLLEAAARDRAGEPASL